MTLVIKIHNAKWHKRKQLSSKFLSPLRSEQVLLPASTKAVNLMAKSPLLVDLLLSFFTVDKLAFSQSMKSSSKCCNRGGS